MRHSKLQVCRDNVLARYTGIKTTKQERLIAYKDGQKGLISLLAVIFLEKYNKRGY